MLHQFLQVQPALDSLDIKAKAGEIAEILQTTTVSDLLASLADKALAFGLKVLAALAIYCIGAWIIKRIKLLLDKVFVRRNTDKAIASFVKSLVSITLTVILVIITVGALGVNTTSLAALLAAGGMAIGMALSGTVQNFAGGIMLLVFRPFKAGDFISAQGFTGTVTEVSIASTKLLTTDNRVIVLPNGALANGTIDNYSEKPYRRIEWTVDVEYGSSSEQTKAVLMSVMKNDPRIKGLSEGSPAEPFVELLALKDSSVQFVMRGWVKSEDYWDVTFAINDKIYNELPKNGINFPFPQLDVHVKKD